MKVASIVVAILVWAGTPGAVESQSGFKTPEDAIRLATAAKDADDRGTAERILRAACERWPDDLRLGSFLGAYLYGWGRIDESLPLLRRVCEEGRFEPACAVSVGIDLVRGRWDEALAAAKRLDETTCYKSPRLWVLKLASNRSPHAVEAAERLVRSEPEKETSYLFLAAAQWLAGSNKLALQTLETGRSRSEKTILLKEKISWSVRSVRQGDKPPGARQ